MDNEKQELQKALLTIQRVCKNSHCEECMISNELGECMIQDIAPVDWRITNPHETRYHALL